MRNLLTPLKHTQQGISLVEILITVLVFSIGCLGLAGLHITSMRGNQSAYYRTVAMLQAYDMADRMRANQAGVALGAYNNMAGAPDDPGCIDAGCSAEELGSYDLYDWNSTNATLLPLGQGTVVAGEVDWIITVRWDGNLVGATGTGCNTAVATDLLCLTLSVRP
jgi:type IV pilus assembly protein PilV